MERLMPALIESFICGALASAFWALADVDPNLWQFTASTVVAFAVLEALTELRRRDDRRAVQK